MIDEISFVFPPAPPLSQIDDIPQEMFCNGDNRPPNCGPNCECVHQVDIPKDAIVEVVLVDEGNTYLTCFIAYLGMLLFYSPISKFKSSLPFAWLLV